MPYFDLNVALTIIIPIVIFLVIIMIVLSFWRRVPADKAMVITGLKKRVLSGKGGFMIPILETSCVISLENISMTTDVTEAPSQQGIFVDVIGTAVIKVRNEKESIYKAVEQFCNGSTINTKDVISGMVEQILEGKLRGIVSTMTVEEINSNRAEFELRVEQDINKELGEMGLQLLSYSILKIATQGGYLENRARPQVAQSKAEAEIAEAERKRDTDIKTAEAAREGQKVTLAADAEVALAERDKRIKMEGFRAEQDKAKADADVAYRLREIEKQAEVEQQKAALAEKAAITIEKELVASIEKPAAAQKKKTEIEAEAQKAQSIRQAEAEAESIRIESIAKAEAKKVAVAAEAESISATARAEGEAIKSKGLAQAEANAENIAAVGRAEAEAIKAKGLAQAAANAENIAATGRAEAETIRAKGLAEAEAKNKIAEAMAKYGEAAVIELLINQLPQIMEQIAKPMANIDKITVIDTGDGKGGASKIAQTVTNVAGSGFEVLKDLTGLDITKLISDFTQKGTTNNNFYSEADFTDKTEK